MTQVATDIGPASEGLEIPFMPAGGVLATDVQAAIQAVAALAMAPSAVWNNIVTTAAGMAMTAGTFYFVTGATGPVTFTLPLGAVAGDAVAVYMEDYTSTVIATVDAGVGNWVGGPLYAQTHRIGAQASFYVYRYISGGTWIAEQPISTKQIRFRSSSPTLSPIYDNSVLYIFSASARTVTMPNDAADNLPVGYQVTIVRYGAGAVSIAATSPVTLNTAASLTPVASIGLPRMNSSGVLTKMGANDWLWAPFGTIASPQTIVTASPYTVLDSDELIFINMATACTLNMPSVLSREGRELTIKDMGNISGHTIARNGTDVFEGGATSFVFYTNFQGQTFIPVSLGATNTWAVT